MPVRADPVVKVDVDRVALVDLARRPASVDPVLGRCPGVVDPPPEPRSLAAAQEELHALCEGALGVDAEAVGLDLRKRVERLVQVLVARSRVGDLPAVRLEPQG